LLVCLLLFSSCGIINSGGDPVVARVRFKYLRQSDIEAKLGETVTSQQEKDFIDHWVANRLWVIEARKHVSLNKSARRQLKDYRESLLVRQYRDNMIFDKIMISENDVLDYYDKNNAAFITDNAAAFVDIYILRDRAEAEALVSSLKNSEQTPAPAQRSLIYKGGLIDALDNKLFSKYPENIIGPVLYADDYYVIAVNERYSPNSLLRVEHVREDIIQRLQMTEYMNALQLKEKELKERINVKIFKNTDY
jgi:hypothetical protein